MSGTSADGIDAAILKTDGESSIEVLGGTTVPYSPEFKRALIQTASSHSEDEATRGIELELTQLHANAVQQCCREFQIELAMVDVVGFHGHTIRHQPEMGITRQIGDGPMLSRLVNRPVVFDFRSADIVAGGQGAPLAPLYHRAVIGQRSDAQVVLNLGGVSNITWIRGDELIAGDTGPGCGLLDALVQSRTNLPYDEDGKIASDGTIDWSIVREALATIPFFSEPLPKSADRFDFEAVDVSHLAFADGAATLCALTTQAIYESLQRLPCLPENCWVTGGGFHHPFMMRLLGDQLPSVRGISELGHSEDLLEAECFGWLAVRRLRELPTSLPATTGCREPVSGGQIARPAGDERE